jgi:hypothetical protein
MDIFYHGDPLTRFEVDTELMYLGKKIKKSKTFQKRRSLRYKVRLSLSDVNRFQQQERTYRMVDPDFFAYAKPKFRGWDMEKMQETVEKDMEIRQTGFIKKAVYNIFEKKHFQRGEKRVMT